MTGHPPPPDTNVVARRVVDRSNGENAVRPRLVPGTTPGNPISCRLGWKTRPDFRFERYIRPFRDGSNEIHDSTRLFGGRKRVIQHYNRVQYRVDRGYVELRCDIGEVVLG